MKTQYGDVSVAMDGHVAVVEVNRPPNNHVSVELMRDLADALRDLDEESACRTVVLAQSRVPRVHLYRVLESKVPRVELVGDARSPRTTEAVIYEAELLARSL